MEVNHANENGLRNQGVKTAGYSLSLTVGRGRGRRFLRGEEERSGDDVHILEGGLGMPRGSSGLDGPLGWDHKRAYKLLKVAPVAAVETWGLWAS